MLIVEDDPDVAALQQAILEGIAVEVRVLYEDFRRAFDAATWLGVSVAILDLMLPEIEGEDICRYLMVEQPQIRRVICTAKPISALPDLQQLAHVVLQKPFRPSDFIHAVTG